MDARRGWAAAVAVGTELVVAGTLGGSAWTIRIGAVALAAAPVMPGAAPRVLAQLGFALGHHGGGGLTVALAHRHLRLRAVHRRLRLRHAGQGFGMLRLQALHLHAGQDLAGLDVIALAHRHLGQAARQLGGHVDLGGLDAAVAAHKARAWPLGLPRACAAASALARHARRAHARRAPTSPTSPTC